MRKARMVPVLLLAVSAVTVSARPATGQTLRFEWPDTAIDLSAYTTVEECRAAIDRVRETVEIHEVLTTHVVPDTMPFDPEEAKRPLPPAVVETSRTCLNAASAHADTVGANAWELLAPVYLSAGMDDSVRAVVARRLAKVEPDNTDELHRLLQRTVSVILGGARPPRYELAEDIVSEYAGRLPKFKDRAEVYGHLLMIVFQQASGNLAGDGEAAALGRRLMARMQATTDSMPPSERQQMVDEAANVTAKAEEIIDQHKALVTLILGSSFLRDSLRVSTETYTQGVRELWERIGMPAVSPLLGKRVPKLEGDVWLGCEHDPCEPYPKPGRVTLVWLGESCADYKLRVQYLDTSWCKVRIPLRRLQDRFPELEIVVVAESSDRFAYVKEGMTPEREAQLMRQWLDTFGLDRAVLTMSETQGWRLPEPDGRWAYREHARNEELYHQGGKALLIDQDGYLVHAGSLGYSTDLHKLLHEEEFRKLIEILLEREGPAT